jgi:hypothetical protein
VRPTALPPFPPQVSVMLPAAEDGTVVGRKLQLPVKEVLGSKSSQADVFRAVGMPAVRACADGCNATVLAYGQTGAGKTFTMSGVCDETADESVSLSGLVPRAIHELFRLCDTDVCTIRASYVELYGDQLMDLLVDEATPAPEWHRPTATLSGVRRGTGLAIVEDPATKLTRVAGLRQCPVVDATSATALFLQGEENRVIGSHALNERSTRSHTVFTLHLERRVTALSSESLIGTEEVVSSKLNLVDLAGSERVSKTGSSGVTLREAGDINKSLSVLEQVVRALVKQANSSTALVGHVPFRSSSLTALLKDSLGGDCHTSLVACVWPAARHSSESCRTLRFASRMLRVPSRPIRHVLRLAPPGASSGPCPTCSRLEHRVRILEHENTLLRLDLSLRDQLGSLSAEPPSRLIPVGPDLLESFLALPRPDSGVLSLDELKCLSSVRSVGDLTTLLGLLKAKLARGSDTRRAVSPIVSPSRTTAVAAPSRDGKRALLAAVEDLKSRAAAVATAKEAMNELLSLAQSSSVTADLASRLKAAKAAYGDAHAAFKRAEGAVAIARARLKAA